MSVLALFPSRIRFVDENGLLTKEAIRALTDIYARLGGPSAPTITELSMVDDEDSGLEEIRLETTKGLDGLGMAPALQMFMQDEPAPPSQFLAPDDPLHPIYPEHPAYEALQSEVSGLRAEVDSLRQQINDLQQGTAL